MQATVAAVAHRARPQPRRRVPSVGLAAIAIFGVFLFLTFYLQLTKGYSPVLTGVAFLPMIAAVLIGSTLANIKLMPILGARLLITIGMALAAVAMAYLYFIDSTSNYWEHIFPSLPVLGFGFGLIFAPAINTATERVHRDDAGVASALVNTTQQVGGSIGTALLSTIAASVTTTYAATHTGAAAARRRHRWRATRSRSWCRRRSSPSAR